MTDWRFRPTLTPQEVARLTGLKPRDVSALVEEGTLGHVVVRGQVLVYTADVIRVFEKPRDPASLQDSRELKRLCEDYRLM